MFRGFESSKKTEKQTEVRRNCENEQKCLAAARHQFEQLDNVNKREFIKFEAASERLSDFIIKRLVLAVVRDLEGNRWSQIDEQINRNQTGCLPIKTSGIYRERTNERSRVLHQLQLAHFRQFLLNTSLLSRFKYLYNIQCY
jgi:hypothetical protein